MKDNTRGRSELTINNMTDSQSRGFFEVLFGTKSFPLALTINNRTNNKSSCTLLI